MATTNSLSSLTSSIDSAAASTSTATSGTGLGTGINVQEFVQYAVADQTAQITSLQTEQTTLGSQTGELSTISTDLNNLDTAAQALNDPLGALGAEIASSSNTAVVNATASNGAVEGSHTVTVNSLATTSSYYTNELANSSTTISSGSFNIQIGSAKPTTITVNSSDNTLSGIATAINNQNAGVTASVIQDANGSRLALVSNNSGAAGDITVSGNTSGLSFTKAVTGANASLTVDGIPISSASNTVSNAISGVTLNLASASPGNPVSVSVNPDTSQASTAINNFASAWNTLITEINNQFTVGSDGTASGVLEADDSLRSAQSLLLGAISYAVPGNNGVVNLASIGLNLNNDGTLSVDSDALNSALTNNFSSVQNLLQNTTNGFSQNLNSVLQTVNAPNTGILSLDSQSITNTSNDLTQQISDLQAALTVQEQNLTTVYAQVNDTLQELPLLQNQLSQQLSSLTAG